MCEDSPCGRERAGISRNNSPVLGNRSRDRPLHEDVPDSGRNPFDCQGKRPAASMRRTFRDPAEASTHASRHHLSCLVTKMILVAYKAVAPRRAGTLRKCQTLALSSNRHRKRLDIRANLGSNRYTNAGRLR